MRTNTEIIQTEHEDKNVIDLLKSPNNDPNHLNCKITPGDAIKYYRSKKNLSQKELGELAFPHFKSANSRINRCENNTIKMSSEDLEAIAEALDITPEKITNPDIELIAKYLKEEEYKNFYISEEIFETLPNLKEYLIIMNDAVKLGSSKHILREICKGMQTDPNLSKEKKTKI